MKFAPRRPIFSTKLAGVGLTLVFLATPFEGAAGTEVVSQLPPGSAISTVGGGDSSQPIVSADGRYVLFSSTANNLVTASNGQPMPSYVLAKENVFLRDRQAGTTILVSVNATGTGGGNGDSWPSAISTNGQYALFDSTAPDLVPGDTNGAKDIFLRDVINGTTTLVSVSTNGFSGNGESREATMTSDGRYVAFVSAANNLVPGDTNGIADIFVRDLQAGTTVLASPGATAVLGSVVTPYTLASSSEWPILSVDGRYVAFYSTATNLVGAGGIVGEVYVRDLIGGVTYWASTNAPSVVATPASANYAMSTNGQFIAYESSLGTPGGAVFRYNVATGATDIIQTNGTVPASLDLDARNVDISADGRFVVFTRTNGAAANSSTMVELWDALSNTLSLVSGGTVGAQCDFPRLDQTGRYVAFFDNESSLTTNSDGNFHVYVRDTDAGTVQLADVGTNGGAPISSLTTPFHFSAQGNLVAFECPDGAMGADTNKLDVFARDLVANTTEVISTPAQALPSMTAFGSGGLTSFSVSSNGQSVAFYSDAAGLTTNATYGYRNIFVHDFAGDSNILASVSTNGLCGNSGSFDPAISADGRYVAFASYASNLVTRDTNNAEDVFVRDLQAGTTTRVSVDKTGTGEGDGNSYAPQLSANGRYVLFYSAANNLVAGATNEFFWRDLQAGTTYAIKGTNAAAMTPDGSNVVYASGSELLLWQAGTQSNTTIATISGENPVIDDVAVSPDGTRAAFGTGTAIYTADLVQRTSTQLGAANRPTLWARFQFSGNGLYLANVVQDRFGTNQAYIYNFQSGVNTLISQSYASGQGGNGICDSLAMSADGRYVAYRSFATNLAPGDTNAVPDIFLYDQGTGETTLLSASQLENGAANGRSLSPVFSGDGQTLFFQSWASDLGTNDFNQSSDVFALALSSSGAGGGGTNAAAPLEFSGLTVPGVNGGPGNGQGPTLTWESVEGTGYQVQYKDNLTDPEWLNLDGRATVVGSQGEVTDLAPNGTQRFYRIISY